MSAEQTALIAALQWHLDAGADEALADAPRDLSARASAANLLADTPDADPALLAALSPPAPVPANTENAPTLMGSIEAAKEAARLAREAASLDDLRAAIAAFDGIAIRKTATNLVFAAGNPAAHVMLIGDAPGADEDRGGAPFLGANGLLLDKMLAAINLSRESADAGAAAYLTNILSWRPPGGRSPSAAELEVSLPFIERHIALIRPKILIFSGAVAAQALLGSGEGISRLRGKFHTYLPRTHGIAGDNPAPIPAIALYTPEYLLKNPAQKRAAWQDLLSLSAKLKEL